MRRFRFVYLTLACGCAASCFSLLRAQTAAASAPDSKIILLSPFEVTTSRDSGYQAFNSLAGGRIDTPLDRTPAALTIQTRDFLEDIAATTYNDAALWSPNSSPIPANPEGNDSRIDFRSTNTGGNPSVNYFPFALTLDAFSTERLEFARGANSILFGEGNLGGIGTIILKQPRFRNFGQVQLRFDDFESRRFTLDLNRQLGDKVVLRFAAQRLDGQRWRDSNPDDRRSCFLAGAVKLAPQTALRFEGEYGTQQRTWAEGIFIDNLSAWNGAGYTGNGSAPVPPGRGLVGIPTNVDYLVYDLTHPERGVLNHRGFARTTGNAQGLALVPGGRPYVPNFPALPSYGFDFQPPNNLLFSDYYFTTVYLERQFGSDLFVQLAVNQREVKRRRDGINWTNGLRRDPNTLLPNGAPNPDFGALYLDGEPVQQRQNDLQRDYRLLATYRLEYPWMTHRLSGFLSWQTDRGGTSNERLVRTDNPATPLPTSGSNFIQQRYYLDRAAGIPFVFDPAAFGPTRVRLYRYAQGDTGADGYTLQAAAVSEYFGGKFNTILGYRRDDTARFAIDSDPDPRTGDLVFTRLNFGEAIDTTSAGAIWYPTRNVGPFFNYSESFSFFPPGEPLLNSRRQPDTPRGRTAEGGIYFKLPGDLLQGSVRYYHSIQHGRIVNAPGLPNINVIWQALGQTERVETGPQRDTQSLVSTGYEFETTALLQPNWRLMLNFAVPRSKQRDSYPETIAYRARFLAQWQAAAGNPMVANALQALDTAILAGANGREQNMQVDYRANLYSSFDFRTGPLRNFGFGAGGNAYGRRLIGNVLGQPFNYLYSRGYTTAAAHLRYAVSWREIRARIQLNVTNAFDRHELIFMNVARYTAAAGSGGVTGDYPASYRYLDPRKFTLTTTFNF